MGAPARVILRVSETSVSAFVLPEMREVDARKINCKECAPARTKMRLVAQIILPRAYHYDNYYIFECSRCLRQFAVPFVAEKPEGNEKWTTNN